jgi:hypothetical protein
MNRKGQNAIEYILLVVAVLTVLIIFLLPQGQYKSAVENSLLNGAIKQMQHAKDEIKF